MMARSSRRTPRSGPRRPRWRRRKEARPEEILQAALDVFVTRGYAAARLDQVARRAGVSKGTIYLYFPGKADLFKAVVRRNIVPLVERWESALSEYAGSSGDALRRLLRTVWEIVGQSKLSGLPKLIIAEAANFPELARFYHTEVASRALALVGGLIQRGVARGEFRPVDPQRTAMVALAAVAPALFAVLWKHSLYPYAGQEFDFPGFIEWHVDNFLRGLSRAGGEDGAHG